MRKIIRTIFFIFTIIITLLLGIIIVSAQEHNFSQTKQLIDSGISCDNLTDEQLEDIGDYYMEQMHPGEAHKIMDNMMGGEGSESLEQVHINMAKRLYCNDDIYVGYGMMGDGMRGGMMNMMRGYPTNYAYNNYGYWSILGILLFATLILLIIWFVYRLGIKKTASDMPLDILKKRFARGEITKKEFDDMKKNLEE